MSVRARRGDTDDQPSTVVPVAGREVDARDAALAAPEDGQHAGEPIAAAGELDVEQLCGGSHRTVPFGLVRWAVAAIPIRGPLGLPATCARRLDGNGDDGRRPSAGERAAQAATAARMLEPRHRSRRLEQRDRLVYA